MPSIDGVYALASSTTMYKQCLPSNSAHIIFSLFGSHYLSKRSVTISISSFSCLFIFSTNNSVTELKYLGYKCSF